MAITASQTVDRRLGDEYQFPVAASTTLYAGGIAALDGSNNLVMATDVAARRAVGVVFAEVDNSTGSAGDLNGLVEVGIFKLANSGTNAITDAHIGQFCFVEDNSIVASTGGSYGVVAGIVKKVDTDGVWVEMGLALGATLPFRRQVLVSSTGGTLTAGQSGAVISNLGASAAATFVLPPAIAGMEFIAVVEVAQELRIDPNTTQTIALPSTGVQGAAGKYLTADAIGEKVHLVCISAGTWDVVSYSGTWTAEA